MVKQPTSQLYLASASPRRHELLKQMALRFERIDATIDELPRPDEAPQHCVERLARAKAEAGWQSPQRQLPLPVLGADTIVVVDSTILGKPADAADSQRMLRLLSGRRHQVMTSVAICYNERITAQTVVSDVYFAVLDEQQISAYQHSGEGRDKAGSYAIQGLGGMFVQRISGSYSAIVGLPLFETAQLLRECGTAVL